MPRVEIKSFAIFLYFSSRLAIWMGIVYADHRKLQNTKESKEKGKFLIFKLLFLPDSTAAAVEKGEGAEDPPKDRGA